MIIVIGATKGGVGKTTIATNFAAIDRSKGQDSLLVDTDRQASSSMWSETRSQSEAELVHVSTIQKYGKSVGQELKVLQGKYTNLFIDAGGYDSVELRAVTLVADRLIVPVRPSQLDIWSIPRIVDLVTEAQIYNPNLTYLFVINGAHTSPNVKDVDEVMELLEGFPVAQTILHHRRAYSKAPMMGMAVTEMGKERDQRACDEMMSLYLEVISG